jgi:hypothetical protein
MEEVRRQQPALAEDITLAQLRLALSVVCGAFLALCVLALIFAAFLCVGREWARRGLMLTAAATVGVCLSVVLSDPSGGVVVLLPAAAAMATVILLRRPEARAWCQDREAARRG